MKGLTSKPVVSIKTKGVEQCTCSTRTFTAWSVSTKGEKQEDNYLFFISHFLFLKEISRNEYCQILFPLDTAIQANPLILALS